MAGDLVTRLNRTWVNATLSNVAAYRFFWDFLNFVNAHENLSTVSYGTGAVEGGTSFPTAWLTWSEVSGPAFGDNSWIVVQADEASAALAGSSIEPRPWQLKMQVANDAAFDDCSGHDYGNEGVAQIVCVRFSPDGGWDHTHLDFAPVSGAAVSSNYMTYYKKGVDYRVHFIGDDDTLWWCGHGGSSINYDINRGTYVGETLRRSSAITKPEILLVGRIADESGSTSYNANISKYTSTSCMFYPGTVQWPSLSLAANAITGVTTHFLHSGYKEVYANSGPDEFSGEDEVYGILVRQSLAPSYFVLGQLRLLGHGDGRHDPGNLLGDNEWLCISDSSYTATYGGIFMQWDPLVVPVF